jgi:hypothetical protein
MMLSGIGRKVLFALSPMSTREPLFPFSWRRFRSLGLKAGREVQQQKGLPSCRRGQPVSKSST